MIHPTAIISKSAKLDSSVEVGPYSVIHDNVILSSILLLNVLNATSTVWGTTPFPKSLSLSTLLGVPLVAPPSLGLGVVLGSSQSCWGSPGLLGHL